MASATSCHGRRLCIGFVATVALITTLVVSAWDGSLRALSGVSLRRLQAEDPQVRSEDDDHDDHPLASCRRRSTQALEDVGTGWTCHGREMSCLIARRRRAGSLSCRRRATFDPEDADQEWNCIDNTMTYTLEGNMSTSLDTLITTTTESKTTVTSTLTSTSTTETTTTPPAISRRRRDNSISCRRRSTGASEDEGTGWTCRHDNQMGLVIARRRRASSLSCRRRSTSAPEDAGTDWTCSGDTMAYFPVTTTRPKGTTTTGPVRRRRVEGATACRRRATWKPKWDDLLSDWVCVGNTMRDFGESTTTTTVHDVWSR